MTSSYKIRISEILNSAYKTLFLILGWCCEIQKGYFVVKKNGVRC